MLIVSATLFWGASVDRRLLIIGAGGHAAVALDCAEKMGVYSEIALCANDVRERTEFLNRPLMSENEALGMALNEGWGCFVAIGRNEVRKSYLQRLTSLGANLETLIHPEAILGAGSTVDVGCIVCARANVGPRATVHLGSIINTGADVEHDCMVGVCCHLSPGALMGGGSEMGEGSWMCIGSCCADHIRICPGVTLGAGSTLLTNVEVPGVYVGSPARLVKV